MRFSQPSLRLIFNYSFHFPGSTDRRPELNQHQPEELSGVQTARWPGLPATAPAALAVLLQTAGPVLARRLVVAQRQATMDWQIHICIKEKAKQETISFLLSNLLYFNFPLDSLSFDSHFDFFNYFLEKHCCFIVFTSLSHCSCVLKWWPSLRVISVWLCVPFGFVENKKRKRI